VPAFGFKQDAVPGQDIVIHFTPTQEGVFDIECAELCGNGHHQMNAKLRVMNAGAYQAWLASHSAAAHSAQNEATAVRP